MPFILNNALVLIPIVLLVLFVISAVRILREYERAVVFQLGRFWKVKGPGLILVVPIIQQAVKVDLRIRVHDIPSQDIISRDNVLVKVNAVVYYRVMDARNAIIQVEDFVMATSQLAQTTLRSVLGQHELDEMLAEREKLNADLQRILDEQTESWGIKVSNVELKHVDIDESMIRVIARQAEAERVRRAKIIEAEGEQQAAQKILEAATILATRPQAMQLRYLGALMTIANERSSTIVFPFPTDLGQTRPPGADLADRPRHRAPVEAPIFAGGRLPPRSGELGRRSPFEGSADPGGQPRSQSGAGNDPERELRRRPALCRSITAQRARSRNAPRILSVQPRPDPRPRLVASPRLISYALRAAPLPMPRNFWRRR